MNKIFLIIQREFLTRVKKKTFIIMSLIGPLLFASLMVAPTYLATIEDTEVKTIAVIDSSKLFKNKIPDTETLKFKYLENTSVEAERESFKESGYHSVLYISHIIANTSTGLRMYSKENISLGIKAHVSNSLEKELVKRKLQTFKVDYDVIDKVMSYDVVIKTIQWEEDGGEKESSSELVAAAGYISGFLIYFFIFLFGSQVMRGVIEEKTNRIVEVIVSSVKPFQLMLGKIVGVALVGLTQFIIWITLTAGMVIVGTSFFADKLTGQLDQQIQAQDLMSVSAPETGSAVEGADAGQEMIKMAFSAIEDINYGVILGAFVFFFLGGYLLYGSLFAAIGAAVDNETDTQQFMAPVTIPLVLGIVVLFSVIKDPSGPIAFWFSIIPFTSPVVMMARIPAGVPYWEVALSMGLLVITFIGTTWMAGKIYRTGILMYGKKISYKELWKWLRYKS